VALTTDLAISGKVAQFGRGMLADVSTALVGQFVECLGSTVLAGGDAEDTAGAAATPSAPVEATAVSEVTEAAVDTPATDAPATAAPASVRRIDAPSAEPVDLLATTASPVATRVAPVAAGLAVLFLLRLFLRRRRRRSG
jgi:hypothetical protein